jgi:hypothetical protein
MYRQLFCAIVFSLFFVNIFCIRCYTTSDQQCILLPNMDDCGEGETCRCIKYRFKCTGDDTACTEKERLAGTIKWAYATVAKSTCETFKNQASGASDAKCCSTDGCNKPEYVKCS